MMYAVPAKFYIPVLYGDAAFVDGAEDYESLADMVEEGKGGLPGYKLVEGMFSVRHSQAVCSDLRAVVEE